MHKKVLTEIDLYYGEVAMPKGFEIDGIELSHYTLHSKLNNENFMFSKTWGMLNTYIIEHFNMNYGARLVNKDTWGTIYSPNQISIPLLDINPTDLKKSPDYTLLYGAYVKECFIKIQYDDNRRKGRSWTLPLGPNRFVMFPSTQMYSIINNQKDSLNFIQTITYEYL
tara:strand:+ start:2460 stop:2963 length:504 start_codon:yes stop_codon:yes gene_type:complete